MVRMIIFWLSLVCAGAAVAEEKGKDYPGCQEAKEFYILLEIVDDRDMLAQMRAVRRDACAGRYSKNDTIRYPNRQIATNWAGKGGETWYYPNGQSITLWAKQEGATWRWPNGQTATLWAYRMGATWRYSNANKITHWAGKKDATYYKEDGQMDRSYAPEFKTQDGRLDTVPFLEFVRDLN